jgi:hypothetical protein
VVGGARGGLRAVRGLCILRTHSVHGVLEGLGGNETGNWRLGDGIDGMFKWRIRDG